MGRWKGPSGFLQTMTYALLLRTMLKFSLVHYPQLVSKVLTLSILIQSNSSLITSESFLFEYVSTS